MLASVTASSQRRRNTHNRNGVALRRAGRAQARRASEAATAKVEGSDEVGEGSWVMPSKATLALKED